MYFFYYFLQYVPLKLKEECGMYIFSYLGMGFEYTADDDQFKARNFAAAEFEILSG